MSLQMVPAAVGIHQVLVAIDFSETSEKALHHAVAIARSYGARFYLTHVVSALGFTLAEETRLQWQPRWPSAISPA